MTNHTTPQPVRQLRDKDIFMSLSGATLLVFGNCAPAYEMPMRQASTTLRSALCTLRPSPMALTEKSRKMPFRILRDFLLPHVPAKRGQRPFC